MDWSEYRRLQEQAVTGLKGGSALEVHLITGHIAVLYSLIENLIVAVHIDANCMSSSEHFT